MNSIALVPTTRGEIAYLEIDVDGKRLAHHFAGRLGGHPSHVSPLGWSSASKDDRRATVAQFLADTPSVLASGRLPVLVCEECGDVRCGAFAVRVVREGQHVRWTDWAWEIGYEPAQPLEWPTRPGDFVFDREAYRKAIREAL